MARVNASLVYPEGQLAICRTDGGTGWEVRSKDGFAAVKEPTASGGQRTVYVRVEGEGCILEKGISKGIDARVAAVRHQVALGMMTEEQGAAQVLKLKPPKAAK